MAEHHKKPLPKIPKRVAVITSPAGAAIHDFLQVIQRRWPRLHVVLVPAQVQGEGAAQSIAAAVQFCDRLPDGTFDVLVVTRGGGSIEDLWCFNEEIVCRQIFNCRTPVVSAVGHEVDVTLSDLAADLRALTPTEAAERLVPDQHNVRRQLVEVNKRLNRAVNEGVLRWRRELDGLASRPVLTRPMEPLRSFQQQLDRLDQRLLSTAPGRLRQTRHALQDLVARLKISFLAKVPYARSQLEDIRRSEVFSQPGKMIEGRRLAIKELERQLHQNLKQLTLSKRTELERLVASFQAHSPIANLARGYSVTTDAQSRPITDCQSVQGW